MRPYSYIAIFAAAVFSVCGCQEELILDSRVEGISFNPFIVGVENTEVTKASAFRSEDGSIEIPAWLTVSDGIAGQARNDENCARNDENCARNDENRHAELDSASADTTVMPDSDPASPETKGTQINTGSGSTALANFASAIGNTFYVTAWKGSTPERFVPSSGTNTYEAVTYSNSKWSTIETKWEGKESATFFAYANCPSTSIAKVTNTSSTVQTLNYYAVPTDASLQKDILLGYYYGDGTPETTDKTCTADLQFHHPLTAVRFKKGSISGTVKFKAIYLDGVYKSGNATMTASGMTSTISWSDKSTTMQEVCQEGSQYLEVEDAIIGDAFLLIPQAITASAPVTVTIVAEIDNVDHPLTAVLDPVEWKAGKTYTYILSREDPASYSFSLSSTSSVIAADKTFTNTTSTAEETYSIYSKKTTNSTTSWDWNIKSYQIGTATPVSVAETETGFTAGGLVVSEDKTNNKLKITAQMRTVDSQGSNTYWQNNSTPARTDNLDWSPADWTGETIDLSKYDFKSDERNAHLMTTANCYIIRHAGTYKIPLVYGNAVKNGGINTTAYNPGTTGSSNLATYLTHKGIGITSPFIEYNKTSASSSTNLSPSGCRVVWSENSGVITDINIPTAKESVTIGGTTYNISYLTFTVPQDKICQNNAVIAVSDGSGTMWSWHIWTTNDPDVAKDPVSVKPNANKEYKFFPMYLLGWIDPTCYLARSDMKITLVQKDSGNEITITVDQPLQAKDKSTGVMYQWGRKDPMPAKDGVTGFNATTPSSGVDLATAIQNPGNAYYPTGTTGGNWCKTNYYNLWSGTLGTPMFEGSTQKISVSSDATTKTVYDPSPVGYKVPSIFAFTPFSTTGNSTTDVTKFNKTGDFNVGWNFYTDSGHTTTIFFYAAGWRESSGLKNSTNGDGNYHSAFQYGTASGTNNHMCYFAFGNNSLYLTNTQSKSLGASVRPVKE